MMRGWGWNGFYPFSMDMKSFLYEFCCIGIYKKKSHLVECYTIHLEYTIFFWSTFNVGIYHQHCFDQTMCNVNKVKNNRVSHT